MKFRSIGAAATLVLTSCHAMACSCLKEEFYLNQDPWAREVLAASTAVLHARVSKVNLDGGAELEIVEALKGPKSPPVLKTEPFFSPCRVSFSAREEFIYLLAEGNSVGLCHRLPPKPELLAAIRTMLRRKD